MERKKISLCLDQIPEQFRDILLGAPVYDSSCSPSAQVYYIEKGDGLFLKTAEKGMLEREARMAEFFYKKKLGAQVLAYDSEEKDWLLTTRVQGEDGTHPMYLATPEKLCDVYSEMLRKLHETEVQGCPVQNRTAEYLGAAEEGFRMERFDNSLFLERQYACAEEAWKVAEEGRDLLKADTLIHGDYCLPNIILKDGTFSGFIDLGNGGVGDRHIDLFWGLWSLAHNLGTNQYKDRFLDGYGREKVDEEVLRVVEAIETFG